MTPSWIQTVFASRWFFRLFLGVPSALTVFVFWMIALSRSQTFSLWDRLLILGCSPVAGVAISLIMLIVGSIVLPPVGWLVCRWNGGPFNVGDTAQVIAGRYRGMIGRVRSTSFEGLVRLDLGEEPEQRGDDWFGGHELMRVPNETPPQR